MHPEEIQYECSDCDTTVQADAKLCPKCGAGLEDITAEVEFDQIPITSNLADTAIIKSLLEDKNIEYSIHSDSLSSVFGLPLYAHSSMLMVRKDQVDLAKEILKDYENEGIKSPTTTVRQSSFNPYSSRETHMKTFKVYKNSTGAAEAVKQGWSWPGFFFPCIWAFAKGLNTIGAIILAVTVLKYFIENPALSLLLNLGLIGTAIWLGVQGNQLRERDLQKKGYKLIRTVEARSPDQAIASA